MPRNEDIRLECNRVKQTGGYKMKITRVRSKRRITNITRVPSPALVAPPPWQSEMECKFQRLLWFGEEDEFVCESLKHY